MEHLLAASKDEKRAVWMAAKWVDLSVAWSEDEKAAMSAASWAASWVCLGVKWDEKSAKCDCASALTLADQLVFS